jgi:toxin CcdB
MARFDVYKFDSKSVPLLVDVQTNLLADLSSCVVVPLLPEATAKEEALPRLKPLIQVDGKNYILVTTDIGTVAKSSLGECVTNLEDSNRQTIIEALDFLFQGF